MFSWLRGIAPVVLALAIVSLPTIARAQRSIDVTIALPAPTLTVSAPFLAQDAGLYAQQGLNVSHRMLVSAEAVNAVISGNVDFAVTAGSVFLRAVAHGQRLLAVANLIDKPLVELVLRTDVYRTLGARGNMTLAERGRLLNGRTIAIQGIGNVIQAWERLVVVRGGLNPETDVAIAPMEASAMLGALKAKAVDGFAASLPYTTEAITKGDAMMFASALEGIAPEYIPFPYALVIASQRACEIDPEKCERVAHALAAANRMIHDEPDRARDILSHRFGQMDQEAFRAAWKEVAQAHATDMRVTPALLAAGEALDIEAKMLDPASKLQSYEGLYTDKYLR